MQTKRIICPKCKVVLDVKNSHDESIKQITCPSCKTILQIRFQPQQEPMEAETFYASSKKSTADYGETLLAGNNNGTTQLVMSTGQSTNEPYLQYDGIHYPLKEGHNIVGRKGTTSKANVQIETSDRYMSRQHSSITITTLPDGTKKAVLCNYQNKNQTIINDQPIQTGDNIRLTDGNSITMGHTTVIFKLS